MILLRCTGVNVEVLGEDMQGEGLGLCPCCFTLGGFCACASSGLARLCSTGLQSCAELHFKRVMEQQFVSRVKYFLRLTNEVVNA